MKSFIFVCLMIFSRLYHGGSTVLSCKDNTSNSPMLLLKQYLLCNYDIDVRPIDDHRNVTSVVFGMNIQHFSVNEMASTLDLHVWTKMMWTDRLLTWTPSEFGGIDMIRIMSDELWVPDITLQSASNMGVDIHMPRTLCFVYTTRVLCVPTMVYTTYCQSDHTWWPYDTLNCTLQFSSWAYPNTDIHIRPMAIEIKNEVVMEKNPQWDLVNITMSQVVADSKFGMGFNSKLISYHILLKRYASMNSAAYITVAIVLSTMTLTVLWLEPKSLERIILANMNFILHLICLQDMEWNLPFNGARLPKLLTFYEHSLMLATLSLILTSILRHLQELTVDAPLWVSSASISILKSRVGQIFLMSILDPKVSAEMELNADDTTNLVSIQKKESTWSCCSSNKYAYKLSKESI
ncbi:Acetylcholine receptor subunit beta [Dufourea novaeangliae]|uniref:Acetylcholine receptor subunit beta n=1 Tax=Dufourea novaeangliae TaxID=178035 RepID=A0A154PNQ9_DUFNO|nr:Acetylcholine receptor subunit beta [Dufourea novaeangliae]